MNPKSQNVVSILFITIVFTVIILIAQLILGSSPKFEFIQAPLLALTIRSLIGAFIVAIVSDRIVSKLFSKSRQYN